MKKKKILLIIAVLLFIFACHTNGRKRTYNSRTEQYRVEFLFEIDGIKVYRFWDNKSVYFQQEQVIANIRREVLKYKH